MNKICVIGSGVMGRGIAGLIANTKTNVLLLDIAISDGVEKQFLEGKSPTLAHPSLMQFIDTGTLDDSLDKIKDCDWIIEVIVEKEEIKADLYFKIAPYIRDNASISSNTSTLPMHKLRGYLPQKLQKNFLLTHFFNPVRQMPLLEIIYDKYTNEERVLELSLFIEKTLGKQIIRSKDTPGFIANRIGCFLMQLCIKEAHDKQIPINLIDAAFIKYLGLPSTGIFSLIDLIGLDVLEMISNVLIASVDKNDKFHEVYIKYDFYQKMLQENYIGRKGLGGFYRINNKQKECLSLLDFQYHKLDVINLPEDKEEFFKNNKHGKNIKNIIEAFFNYTSCLVGEISDSKADIDEVMKLGYSWKYGPFELMEENISKSQNSKSINKKIILDNASAYLYEVKPGNFVLSFKTKMNVLNSEVFDLIIQSVEYVNKHSAEKLIIYNESKHFSAGADLKMILDIANNGDTEKMNEILLLGQKAMLSLKYSKVPTISCARGFALGGGCELLLHSQFVVAHLDLCAGLVEAGVGLIPGWGGLKEMALRSDSKKESLLQNLNNILYQTKSSSAYFFFEDFKVNNGHVVMNQKHLLEYALENKFSLHYEEGKAMDCSSAFHSASNDLLSYLTSNEDLDDHTIFIAKLLQEEMNSSSLSEEELLEIERRIFLKLLILDKTKEKISSVVGK
ncbi:MAG UNVERIFIED_CONTAM: 3-hydroxyacyl-CoA dehydrogenase NAD-binding domain-containing protein [Rickettsiaceae bacterium]|jgi:3-hydroxyacyl-CoA dehydrogenase/enoyl-CoA hydratase/3-hydroxybutyryl-CoA epimerase